MRCCFNWCEGMPLRYYWRTNHTQKKKGCILFYFWPLRGAGGGGWYGVCYPNPRPPSIRKAVFPRREPQGTAAFSVKYGYRLEAKRKQGARGTHMSWWGSRRARWKNSNRNKTKTTTRKCIWVISPATCYSWRPNSNQHLHNGRIHR